MTVTRSSSALALGLALGIATPGVAWAHAHLLSETPAANETVGSPPEILRLKFSEELELKLSTIVITGPDKAPIKPVTVALEPKDAKVMVVTLAGPLAAGHYDVQWHATATDTHRTQGHYGFTVK